MLTVPPKPSACAIELGANDQLIAVYTRFSISYITSKVKEELLHMIIYKRR